MKYPSFILVAVLFALHLNGNAQIQPDSLNIKADNIFKKYIGTKGPGCAVAVIKNGRVLLVKSYGMANLEYNIPVTNTSVFDIASLAKQFTGLAVSTLIQQGKMGLDDDVHKYEPDLPDFGRKITIANLLHHTSGLRDWVGALHVAGWDYEEEASFEQVMRMLKHQKELDFEPGAEYQYSNSGYNLLADIVAKVSGTSFNHYIDSVILKPLGMNSSLVLDDGDAVIPNLAVSYNYYNNAFHKVQDVLTAAGSSSLYSSVDDLTKWVINFQQQIDAKNPVYLRMIAESKLNNGTVNRYGFGIENGIDRGIKTYSHTGMWAGYCTTIAFYPEDKLAFILLSNGSDSRVYDRYVQALADIFIKKKFKPLVSPDIAKLPEVKVDTALLRKYTGSYKSEDGIVEVGVSSGKLTISVNGSRTVQAKALTDSSFYAIGYQFPIFFSKPVNGYAQSFSYADLKGERFVPGQTPGDISVYAGTYYCKELETTYRIDVTDGKLTIHHFRLGDIPLTFKDKDLFSGDLGKLKFYRNGNNRISGFKLSGDRNRNINFSRKQE